jgi:hypothetical protein
MRPRELLLRLARSAGLASAYGIAVTAFFYALYTLGHNFDYVDFGAATPPFDFGAIPKPEEFGWLVGALAAVALFTAPLPRAGPWWAWGLARASAGTLAVALPVDALARASGAALPAWAYPLFWGPLFVGLFLSAWPTAPARVEDAAREDLESDARA